MGDLKRQVLKCYKALAKAKNVVFEGDKFALNIAQQKLREGFYKNKDETDPAKISEMIKLGFEVEHELRTTVIQANKVKEGVYRLKIRPEIQMHENFMYRDDLIPPPRKGPKCK